MIHLTLPIGSVELTEEQARAAILELQAALFALQEAARKQEREAKADGVELCKMCYKLSGGAL